MLPTRSPQDEASGETFDIGRRNMRHPQILVFERDGRLALLLRSTSEEQGWSPVPRPDRPALEQWSLREPGQLESCLRLLRRGSPAVLVMRVGSKLEQELTLLERVHWLRPHARVVVVGDLENEPLAGLAWDFGASFVLFPPQPRSLLPGVVAQLMRAAIARQRSTAGAPASVSEDESDEDDVADEPPIKDKKTGDRKT